MAVIPMGKHFLIDVSTEYLTQLAMEQMEILEMTGL
jgi:hypothetical protein